MQINFTLKGHYVRKIKRKGTKIGDHCEKVYTLMHERRIPKIYTAFKKNE